MPLARPPKQISLCDVIGAFEEPAAVKRPSHNRRMPMKHSSYHFVLVFLSALALTGCEVIGDILKAGVWTGVLLV